MQFAVARGVGVLHRHLRSEFDVRTHGLAKILVGRHRRPVERCHVQIDEALALLLVDLESAMHLNQMREPEFAREPVRTAERFGRKRREVIHMLRLARTEQWLQKRIGEHAVVEELLEAMDPRLAPGVFEQGRHGFYPASGEPRNAGSHSAMCTTSQWCGSNSISPANRRATASNSADRCIAARCSGDSHCR